MSKAHISIDPCKNTECIEYKKQSCKRAVAFEKIKLSGWKDTSNSIKGDGTPKGGCYLFLIKD